MCASKSLSVFSVVPIPTESSWAKRRSVGKLSRNRDYKIERIPKCQFCPSPINSRGDWRGEFEMSVDLDLGNLEMAEAGSRGRRLLHLRRGDQMEAARLLRRLLPEAEARSQVLRLVATAIQEAHAVNPAGWGITLNAGNIRLNIGRVAVIRIDREWVRLTLDPSLLPVAFLPGKLPPLQQSFPRTLPGCAGVWFDYQECAAWVPVVQAALRAAVVAASRSMTALHHPFQRAHSPSVLNCLRIATGETLPEPGWHTARGTLAHGSDEPQTVVYGRTEADRARFILERLLPETEGRRACLQAFAASILQAQEVAPDRWSVTLYPNKVWLNVGPVMVCSLHPGMLWRALDGAELDEPALRALGNRLDAYGYSVVLDSTGLESTPEQVTEDCTLSDEAHRALLQRAIVGRALKQGREDHSAGLLEYLRTELGLALPDRATVLPRVERRRSAAATHCQPAPVAPPVPAEEIREPFQGLRNRLQDVGLHVPAERLANYLLALQTKRFVLLCGITGTGKTRLAMEVGRYFNTSGGRTEVVAVRPDWTDNRGLLGYYNPITGGYVSTPCLRILLDAAAEVRLAAREGRPACPFFLLLDEMNLARVEHYFSDFLSCLESGEPLHLHDQPELERGANGIPCRLTIPENLFLTGTVNVDETTFMFSAKVLDRAFALEFNEVDLAGLVGTSAGSDEGVLDLTGQPRFLTPPASITVESARWLAREHPVLWETVTALHTLLAARQRHFGYRVANEVARFVELAAAQTDGSETALWTALDLVLLQKVLPKFHGMQQELEPTLEELERFAVRLPRFQAKVTRMLARLRAVGFTAYME